jgi:hypothetical protein
MQYPTTATHKDINPPQPGTQEYNIFQSFTIFKPISTVLRHPLCKIALPGRSQLFIHSPITQKNRESTCKMRSTCRYHWHSHVSLSDPIVWHFKELKSHNCSSSSKAHPKRIIVCYTKTWVIQLYDHHIVAQVVRYAFMNLTLSEGTSSKTWACPP